MMDATARRGVLGALWVALAVGGGSMFAVLAVRACMPFLIMDYGRLAAVTALIVLTAVTTATRFSAGRGESEARFIVMLLVFFVVTRTAWVIWSPTLPLSDFAFYDRLAHELAAGGPVTQRWPHTGMVSAWGYPVALAGAYWSLGRELLVAKLFNVVLGAVAVVALYAFARRVAGRGAARGAFVLFALWPGQLLYSAVLASENLAVPLLLVALAIVARVLEEASPRMRLAALACAGIVLAASFSTRSILGIAVLVVVLCLLLEVGTSWPYRLVRCGALLAPFAVASALYLTMLQAWAGVAPAAGGAWSLLVGTNLEHGGMWNVSDVETFTSYPDVESANRFARAAAWQRIRSAPRDFAVLAVVKIGRLWESGTEATAWTTMSMSETPAAETMRNLRDPATAIAQSFHVVVLLLAALGMLRVAQRPPSMGVLVALLYLVLQTLLHGALETQSRYNFTMQPVLFVFAALGLAREGISVARGPVASGSA